MEDLNYHDIEWIGEEYSKQALWSFALRFSLKCAYCRYLYEDEFNRLTADEKLKLQDEFDRIIPEAHEAALKREVKLDFFACALKSVLFMLGYKIELRCVRGQTIVSGSSIQF